MSFLKNISLLLGGATAGVIASKISQVLRETPGTSQDIMFRQNSELDRYFFRGASVAKFFDSPLGQRVQPFVLKSMEFVARVKQGMDERESQLKDRFEGQRLDDRPGAVRDWPLNDQVSSQLGAAETLEGELDTEDLLSPTKNRIQRDQELGKDFFS